MEELRFKVELNVLNHLGMGLYSSTPAVVTEIIANSWDADAEYVDIRLDPAGEMIVVDDDGHGMTEDDVRNKFLKIGYTRRTKEPTGNLSKQKGRHVMGRKGIGKLAMFSLADQITVITKALGAPAVAFCIDVVALKKLSPTSDDILEYPIDRVEIPQDFTAEHGTRIVLERLNNRINKTEDFLRPRLARRFSIFENEFVVLLNNKPVERRDSGFYDDLQFLWHFDETSRIETLKLATSIPMIEDSPPRLCAAPLTNQVRIEQTDESGKTTEATYALSGFIGTVDTPQKLGKGEESINRIAIFANGRVFQDDILADIGDARYFTSYLIGEVHADFLDRDSIDRATASREAIKRDDPEYQALRRHLRSVLATIRDQWDDWRRTLGYKKTKDSNPTIKDWIDSFPDPRDRKLADRLMTSIANLPVSDDPDRNKNVKNALYRSAIVGFEKLRVRHKLDELEHITDVMGHEFRTIFSSLDDIEESHYLDITRSRLEIIKCFQESIVHVGALERVAQEYLFEHLWLLDPSWGRVSGSEVMEQTLTEELKRACPDAEKGARLDIAYRTTSGRHVIIELKRPGKYLKAHILEEQGRKYYYAMDEYYRSHPDFGKFNSRVPPIDIFILVSKTPEIDERIAKSLDAFNIRFITYDGLIENARNSYQEYFDVKKKVGRIEQVLSKLEPADA